MSIEREMAEDSAGVMDVVARPPTERTLGSWTTSGLKFRRPRSLGELLRQRAAKVAIRLAKVVSQTEEDEEGEENQPGGGQWGDGAVADDEAGSNLAVQDVVEEEQVDAVADDEAGSSLAVQDVAEEEQVDAEADAEAGSNLAEQGMAEEEQVLTLAHETGPPTLMQTRTRKRDSSLCVGLPDKHKAAHKNRCAVEMRKQVFAVGNAVQARWGGAKGDKWHAGKIVGVCELSAEEGGPAWTYDIAYNDGDRETRLAAQYVRDE